MILDKSNNNEINLLKYFEGVIGLIDSSAYINCDKFKIRKIFLEQNKLRNFINKSEYMNIKISNVEFEPELDEDSKDKLFDIISKESLENLITFINEKIYDEFDIRMITFFIKNCKNPIKVYNNSLVTVETDESFESLKKNFGLFKFLIGFDLETLGDFDERK